MSTITKELAKLFRKITNSEIDAEGNAHVVLSPADSLLINNARIALASLEAEAVAWIVGGIATHDKKWAVRRSEEDNLLMEPLYMHPTITGIDENHYDPELEPGLYVAEIMTKGGAAIINGYYTAPQPLTTSERAELENYRKAQPVVPDDAQSRELFEKWCSVNIERNKWHPEHYAHLPAREQWSAWSACRAAMLQGGKS